MGSSAWGGLGGVAGGFAEPALKSLKFGSGLRRTLGDLAPNIYSLQGLELFSEVLGSGCTDLGF